ncbi:TetR/AcrR family transcriptional regulator [Pseudonocardia endophytica]|uniref:TetR family transcriptional regulator n=1 Tax=Pseudonocardia endophytica TaxID=401976 RepID=A0A4R1HZK7_PSEEN|nr:TetR/AcrR family transcriptional regulator [Pseudonocardia endophytica]TCK27023.1 TetR family transcriptional regulator [Pseudonocardia endophytica]
MGDLVKTNDVPGRKRLILDGAAEVLAANGFHGARMAQIAGASGITGPALYRHFAGKDALHAAVIERGIDIVEETMARAGAGPPDTVLGETVAGLARNGIEHAPLWLILLRDARHLPAEERARHSRRAAAIVDDLTARVAAVRPDLPPWGAELVARALLVFTASPSGSRVRGMNDTRRRRLLERMLLRLTEVRFDADGAEPPATPGDLPAPVARAARREAIINAAHHLFRRHGFHAVSMEDVAVAAGVTGPTVYSYFESKAELLVVAQQRGSSWLALSLEHVMRIEQSATGRFDRGMRSYVDFALDHGDTMAVLVREACNLPESQMPTVLRDHHDYTTEMAALLHAARPGLDEPAARFVVCGGLDLVSFMAVSRRYVGWADLRAHLLSLVDAVSSIGES